MAQGQSPRHEDKRCAALFSFSASASACTHESHERKIHVHSNPSQRILARPDGPVETKYLGMERTGRAAQLYPMSTWARGRTVVMNIVENAPPIAHMSSEGHENVYLTDEHLYLFLERDA